MSCFIHQVQSFILGINPVQVTKCGVYVPALKALGFGLFETKHPKSRERGVSSEVEGPLQGTCRQQPCSFTMGLLDGTLLPATVAVRCRERRFYKEIDLKSFRDL